MGVVWTIAVHELRLVAQNRGALLWMLLLPIVFATFLGLVMGESGEISEGKVHLTLIDEDRGAVAAALRRELADERLTVVELAPEEKDAAEDKIRTLVLPPDLTSRVLAGEQVTLRLEKDPDTSAQAALVAQARILAAISRVIARLVEAVDDGGPLTVETFEAVQAVPDSVTVDTRFAGRARIVPGGFVQSVPGNVVMFVLLVMLTYGAASLSDERTRGILRRLGSAPVERWELIAGKIAGRFLIAVAQISLLIAVAAVAESFFDLGLSRLGQVYLFLLVYALAVAPLAMLIGGAIRDPDRAANVGVLSTLVMASLGGCWWPLEVVSEPLRKLAHLFPTGWAMDGLQQILTYGRGLDEVVTPILVLLGFAVAGTIAASRALRHD